jgi:hypothetical protein
MNLVPQPSNYALLMLAEAALMLHQKEPVEDPLETNEDGISDTSDYNASPSESTLVESEQENTMAEIKNFQIPSSSKRWFTLKSWILNLCDDMASTCPAERSNSHFEHTSEQSGDANKLLWPPLPYSPFHVDPALHLEATAQATGPIAMATTSDSKRKRAMDDTGPSWLIRR